MAGDNGGGVAEAHGVGGRVDVHVGTLSKAFGAHGGFVATSAALKRLLLSRGRAGIYSTALPMPAVAAASAALEMATPALRGQLWANIDSLARQLTAVPVARRVELVHCASPVIPILIGTEEAALDAAATLRRAGLLVPAIRPPTVPVGTARLRVALSAAHSEEDIAALASALASIGA